MNCKPMVGEDDTILAICRAVFFSFWCCSLLLSVWAVLLGVSDMESFGIELDSFCDIGFMRNTRGIVPAEGRPDCRVRPSDRVSEMFSKSSFEINWFWWFFEIINTSEGVLGPQIDSEAQKFFSQKNERTPSDTLHMIPVSIIYRELKTITHGYLPCSYLHSFRGRWVLDSWWKLWFSTIRTGDTVSGRGSRGRRESDMDCVPMEAIPGPFSDSIFEWIEHRNEEIRKNSSKILPGEIKKF